jgi:glycosyltransferase involved in cell wall biosynthesis
MAFFSVILPTYNRASVLLHAINEVQKQTFDDWELIIVDDSLHSQQQMIQEIGDNRINYFHRGKKLGVGTARNVGVELAKSEFVIFLDDDDDVTESWLRDFYQSIQLKPLTNLIICNMEVVDFAGATPKVVRPNRHLYGEQFEANALPGSFCIKKDLFAQAGAYDPVLHFGENTELFFRITACNPVVSYVESPNYRYRSSVDGASKNLKYKIESLEHILEKHQHKMDAELQIKRLYLQIIGVSYMRLGNYSKPRKYLWNAYTINPFKVKTLLRFGVSLFPFIAKRIYKIKTD